MQLYGFSGNMGKDWWQGSYVFYQGKIIFSLFAVLVSKWQRLSKNEYIMS